MRDTSEMPDRLFNLSIRVELVQVAESLSLLRLGDFHVHSHSHSMVIMVSLICRRFPPGLFWTFVFILIFLISYNSESESMPYCVKDCNRKFANDAALSRHRKACPVLEIARQRSQDLRKDKGIGRSIHNPATFKLLTRKQRLQVSNCLAFTLKVFYLRFSGTSKFEWWRSIWYGFDLCHGCGLGL